MKPLQLRPTTFEVKPIYSYGSLFLVLINGFLAYQAGLARGIVGARLIGYAFSFLIIPLIVVIISLLRPKNRNLNSMFRLAFYSLLFCLALSLDNYLGTRAPAR